MTHLSDKQLAMLKAFRDDGEASDIYDFDRGGSLGWRNRERVIDALRRKGMLDDDGITNAGLTALSGR